MARPVQVVIIHANTKEDADLRDALRRHLAPRTHAGEIEAWGVHSLLPGAHVEAEVGRRLAAADLLVPLVSADLFASEDAHALLQQALRRHRDQGTPLVPVLVRPADWKGSALGGLKALPAGEKPVTSWGNQDEAWLSVVEGLRRSLAPAAGGDAPRPGGPAQEVTIRILHLSDLHIEEGSDASALLQPLAADLRDPLDGLGVTQLDYLVVSGDLTNRAKRKEFECARSFLAKLTETFGLSKSHVAIVPGNHDLSWEPSVYDYKEADKVDVKRLPAGSYVQEGQGYLVRNDKRYLKRFENFSKHLYEPLLGRPYPLNAAEQGISSLSEDGRIQFLLLNSSWQIDKRFPGRSAILGDALSRALEGVDAALRPEHRAGGWRPLRIAVWHHPVTGNEKIVDDAFLGRLLQADVRLCMHGHVHEIRADILGYQHPTRRVHVIGAGSFGAPSKDRPESTPALYNLIEVDPLLHRAKVHTRGRDRRGGAFRGHAIWPGRERHTLCSFYSVVLGDHGWAAKTTVEPQKPPTPVKSPGPAAKGLPPSDRVAEVETAVATLLAKRPRVAAELAKKLGVTPQGEGVAQVVAHELVHKRTARDVVRVVNHVDDALMQSDADLADRITVRHLLWQLLPLAIDWRQLVETFVAESSNPTRSIDLPLELATVAEIVVAGVEQRRCRFAPCDDKTLPIGAAAIRVPAAAQTAMFDMDGSRLAEWVVYQVAAATGTDPSSGKLKERLEGALSHAREAAGDGCLPYYLLFEQATPEQGPHAHDLWALARATLPRELPSLRLVRLSGGAAANEEALARHIRDILRRNP